MRLKAAAPAPDLKATGVAVLLAGWCADPPPGVPPGPHGFGSGFLELYLPGGMARLWHERESWLRATAAAWQWAPHFRGPDGVRRFHAEALAWEEAAQGEPSHKHPRLHTDERDDEEDAAE